MIIRIETTSDGPEVQLEGKLVELERFQSEFNGMYHLTELAKSVQPKAKELEIKQIQVPLTKLDNNAEVPF